MTTPTTVWVNIMKDREGKPRGFEKSTGIFHLEADHADAERIGITGYESVECVMMSKADYDEMVSQIPAPPDHIDQAWMEERERNQREEGA